MLDGLEGGWIRNSTRSWKKIRRKLEEKLEEKLKPIRTDILTPYGEVHGLKNEMAECGVMFTNFGKIWIPLRNRLCTIRTELLTIYETGTVDGSGRENG